MSRWCSECAGEHRQSVKIYLFNSFVCLSCIKSNGIICGDDYDSPVSDSNIEELRKHIDNPKAPHHPGLSVAVYEAFGQVNNSNGFWWVYMKDGKPSLV